MVWKEVLMWGLGGVGAIAAGLAGFFGKTITGLLKGILDELKKLTGISLVHEERIKVLEETRRDHEERLRTIEGS